jgi:hypothetical protein
MHSGHWHTQEERGGCRAAALHSEIKKKNTHTQIFKHDYFKHFT